jgi:hypothetical protein
MVRSFRRGPATTFYNLFLLVEGPVQPASGMLFEGSNTLTVKAHTANPVIILSM